MATDDRFATAGFALPDVRPWSHFLATGELARTLTRACVLVESRVPLAYELRASGAALALHVRVGEVTADLAVEPPSTAQTLEPLARIVRAIDDAIADAGFAEQLAIVELPDGPRAERTRVVVLEPGDVAAACELGPYVACCVSDRRRTTRTPTAALATLEAIEVAPFSEDGSLGALVAGYVERLARFAGIAGVTCEPVGWQAGVLELRLHHRPDGRGGLTVTTRVPIDPSRPSGLALDVQPILDDLNRLLGTAKQLYRVARDPDRVDVARLDRATAGKLRRRGELIEHPAREALRVLADAGFELPPLWGEWKYHGASTLRGALDRLAALARPILAIATDVTLDELGGVTVRWTVADRSAATVLGPEHAEQPVTHVLAKAIAALNAGLAAAGCAHRCVVMTGEPHFYTPRMLLLDRAWLAVVAHVRDVLPGCLGDEPFERVVATFPPASLPMPPRLPRIEELVAKASVLDSDFKCSARPSDLASVIEELARFARVAIEVAPEVAQVGHVFVFEVSYRGNRATIELENTKYARVAPIVDYLNAILATRSPRRQLYVFRGGGYSGGVVRATDEEAAALRDAGYL